MGEMGGLVVGKEEVGDSVIWVFTRKKDIKHGGTKASN